MDMMVIPAKMIRHLSESQILCKPVVVIVGPTAVGKSRVAVEVAKVFATDVLTADSRQVYRGMDVGTDKPAPEERQAVPHRLIDLVDRPAAIHPRVKRFVRIHEIDQPMKIGRASCRERV